MTAPDFRVYVPPKGFRDPTEADFRAAGWVPAAEVERLTQERDANPAYQAWARERDQMRTNLATSRAEVERLRAVLTALVDDSEGQQHRVAWQDACEVVYGHRGPEVG